MIKHKFKLDIYNDLVINVYITDKVLDIPLIRDKIGDDDFRGITITKGNQFYVVLNMNSNINVNRTIPHESFHIVCNVMEYCGVEYSRDSEEAYAYLLGYISDKIYNIYDIYLKKYPKKFGYIK